LTYQIDVLNTGTLAGNQVQITATLPKEVRLVNATGPARFQQDGQKVVFAPVDNLQPKQSFTYTIEVEAVQPGDVRFQVALRSQTLTEPVMKEESTTIYDTGSPPKPAAAAPGAAGPAAGAGPATIAPPVVPPPPTPPPN
jgi:hypothetical protein